MFHRSSLKDKYEMWISGLVVFGFLFSGGEVFIVDRERISTSI